MRLFNESSGDKYLENPEDLTTIAEEKLDVDSNDMFANLRKKFQEAKEKNNGDTADTEEIDTKTGDDDNYGSFHIPELPKKVIVLASVVDSFSDIMGGAVVAKEMPNDVDLMTPKSSYVISDGDYDGHAITELINEYGFEIQENSDFSGENLIIDIGQAIDSMGSDDEELAERVFEESNLTITDENEETANDEIGLLNDKYTEIKKQPLTDEIADSFANSEYRSVVTNEDLTLYRVYGGGSTKRGNLNGDYIFLSPTLPSDKMEEKMGSALSNRWQGPLLDEDGKQKFDENGSPLKVLPNTREFYCEVYVPRGSILNIGRVQRQDTLGGQELPGGRIQVVVSKENLSFGEEKKLGFSTNYEEFEKKARKIENS